MLPPHGTWVTEANIVIDIVHLTGVSKSPSFREHDVNRKHVYRVMLYLALTWRCVAP